MKKTPERPKHIAPDDVAYFKGLVVEAYTTAPSLKAAAEQVGVAASTVRYWKKNDEQFASDLADAHEDYRDSLREHVHQRATGFWKPVIYRGEMMFEREADGTVKLDANFDPIPLREPVYDSRQLELLASAHLYEFKKARGGGMSIGIEGGGEGAMPTKVVVNFVDPPDWDNVQWDPETGRAVLPGETANGRTASTPDPSAS